jgi:hypothetical protein
MSNLKTFHVWLYVVLKFYAHKQASKSDHNKNMNITGILTIIRELPFQEPHDYLSAVICGDLKLYTSQIK